MMQSSQATRIEVIARGIMFHGELVLLCQNLKHGYFYLPGGHVEAGETASIALAREMQEEAAIAVTVGEVVRVEEHLFTQGAKARHEMNVYFRMTSDVSPSSIRSVEEHIAFVWVPASELESADIRPAHCREILQATGQDSGPVWRSVSAG